MQDPRLFVLPAKDPHPVLNRHGMSLTSWPRHRDKARRWPTVPVRTALTTQWQCDAMIGMYVDVNSPDELCWRYSIEILGMPEGEGIYLAALFVDLDTDPHEPWRNQGAIDRALEALREALPIGWYSTRSGLRGVAILPDPVPLRLARDYLRTWHTTQSQRLAPLLEHLDLHWDLSCAEWSRMFRLPYVIRGGDKGSVVDSPEGPVWTGSKTWEPDPVTGIVMRADFSSLELPDPPTPSTEQSAPDHVIHIAASKAPTVPPKPPEGWASWISDGSVAGARKLALQAGEPWGPPLVPHGERNNLIKSTVNSLASMLWRHVPGRPTTEDLYSIMYASVAAELARDPRAPTLEDLWRLCNFAATLERDRRELKAPPDLSVDGGYPPLVGFGDGCAFVFDGNTGTYRGPFRGSDLYMEIKEHIPIPTKQASGKSMRGISEILDSHGVRADRVELCYPGQARGEPWDAVNRVLRVEAFEAPHGIAAAEHPEVAEWLWHLTSAAAPGVADAFQKWLATIGYLQHATAALYLDGTKGTGKGMLASGLAMLWRRPRISFKEAIARFNEGLIRSPLIFLDEEQEMGKTETGALRSLTAESEHRIEGKGKELFTLYGNPRMIMGANNGNLLKMHGSHGTQDIEAIIDRVLHVNVSDGAARFLRSIGGKRGTHDWVVTPRGNPGRIAEHVVWLHQQIGDEYVKNGAWDRFLVPGIRTDYHTKLITSDPLYGQVLVAVASALAPVGGTVGGPGVYCRGDGSVHVNPKSLHERWRQLVNEDAWRPTLQQVAGALEAISGRGVEVLPVGGTMAAHWCVPGELVLRVATDVGHGGVERIRQALAHGTAVGDTAPKPGGGMFGKDRGRVT